MPLLNRAGGKIHYERLGQGAPLVILRGLARSVRHWIGFERDLAKHFDVIMIELRGIGRSTAPWTWTTSIFDIADDVAAVLDAESVAAAHVLGVSLGGMVALGTGLKHPARCQSVITLNTSIAGQRVPRLTLGALRAIGRSVRLRDASVHAPLVDVLVGRSCPPERRREVATLYAQIAAEDGLYGTTAVRQLASAGRFFIKSHLGAMKPPTLVIYGTDDRFVPHLNSRKLAEQIPGATLVPIDGGGHELSLDSGPQLIEELLTWSKSVMSRPPR
jgi:3-oxoadipate enol-lactonase